MEITRKNNSPALGTGGVLALAAGAALLCYSLWMLPASPAYGFPWELALAVGAFAVIAVGGWCLGALVRGRREKSIEYGKDDTAGGIIFALWVVIAGALLLAFNAGVLPVEWRRVFFSWQMLLLLGGATELARGHFTFGTILLIIGGYFIVRLLGPIYPEIAASGIDIAFWPVVLIIAGILILGGIIFGPRRRTMCCGGKEGWSGNSTKASGVVDITTVFGGSEQVYLDPVFRGGKISTVFGGVKLDLRRTELPEGETFLVIESVFGGVEIDTPEEWNIEIRGESVFGGFVDRRLPPVGPGYTDGRKLIVKASSVFGGGEIK